MKTLPERLDATLVSEGESESTGAKRQVWQNKDHGVTLVVTWAEPRPEIGVQVFTCRDLPLHQFTSYEALRTAYAKHWADKFKCKSCDGYGTVSTGITESPTTICERCDGLGTVKP